MLCFSSVKPEPWEAFPQTYLERNVPTQTKNSAQAERKKVEGFLFYCHMHLAFIMFLPQAPAGLWGSQQWFGL